MNTIVKNILFILLVVVCFALGFFSGCQTIHGVCADGMTAFTIAERGTRRFAEKQTEWDSRMKEEDLHSQLTEAEQRIVESHQRAERFAQKDPVRETAEDKNNQ